MNDELYKFATQSRCDCNKTNGCSVCQLKHSNEREVVEKMLEKDKMNHSCIVDNMNSETQRYMKGLMFL